MKPFRSSSAKSTLALGTVEVPLAFPASDPPADFGAEEVVLEDSFAFGAVAGGGIDDPVGVIAAVCPLCPSFGLVDPVLLGVPVLDELEKLPVPV